MSWLWMKELATLVFALESQACWRRGSIAWLGNWCGRGGRPGIIFGNFSSRCTSSNTCNGTFCLASTLVAQRRLSDSTSCVTLVVSGGSGAATQDWPHTAARLDLPPRPPRPSTVPHFAVGLGTHSPSRRGNRPKFWDLIFSRFSAQLTSSAATSTCSRETILLSVGKFCSSH